MQYTFQRQIHPLRCMRRRSLSNENRSRRSRKGPACVALLECLIPNVARASRQAYQASSMVCCTKKSGSLLTSSLLRSPRALGEQALEFEFPYDSARRSFQGSREPDTSVSDCAIRLSRGWFDVHVRSAWAREDKITREFLGLLKCQSAFVAGFYQRG